MKKREMMLQTSLIDLLLKMNQNMRSPAAGVNVCIYNAFGHTADQRKERCAEHCGNCSECIESLIDEEVQQSETEEKPRKAHGAELV